MFIRKVNRQYDNVPSRVHCFNSKFINEYIKGKKVIDIGCWTGQLEQLIAGKAKRVIGIDPDASAINFAKRNVLKAKFTVGTVAKLPRPKGKFDIVLFLDVIEHLPPNTEEQSLNEINKVLKVGGTLILSTPNKHLLSILFDPAFIFLGHRHYSLRYLTDLLEKQGFMIEKVDFFGGSLFLLNHIFELIQKHFFNVSIKLPVRIESLINKSCTVNKYAEIYLVAKKVKNT